MSHESRFAVIGRLTAPTIALARAQRDAFIVSEHRIVEPHDDVIFDAAVAALQSMIATIDPSSAGTLVASSVDTGCSDASHVTPYVQMSKTWQLANPSAELHSWSTTMLGITAPEQALALTQVTACMGAQGRALEAGDTAVFNALTNAVLGWVSAVTVTTPVHTQMSASVSDGSLDRVSLSLGIWTEQPVIAPPDPLAGVVSPPAIVAPAHNYNPAGLATATDLRLSSALTTQISGLTAPAASVGPRALRVYNVGVSNITLLNNSALSLVANRFLAGGNVLLNPNEGCSLVYDPVALRWRIVGAHL